MAQQSLHQPGFPLARLIEFERLFLDIVAITAVGTSLFALLGNLHPDRASAADVESIEQAIVIDRADPASVGLSADPGEPPTIQLYGLPSFDCLVSASPSLRHYCASEGYSYMLIPGSTPVPIDLQNHNTYSPNRLNLFQVEF